MKIKHLLTQNNLQINKKVLTLHHQINNNSNI